MPQPPRIPKVNDIYTVKVNPAKESFAFSGQFPSLTTEEVKAFTPMVTTHVELLAESGIQGPIDDRWLMQALRQAVDKVFESHGQPAGTTVAQEIVREAFAAMTAVTLIASTKTPQVVSNMAGPPPSMPEVELIAAFEAEVNEMRAQAEAQAAAILDGGSAST